MTDLLRTLYDNATPGEWRTDHYAATQEEWGPNNSIVTVRHEYPGGTSVTRRHLPYIEADAEFIAEVHNALPSLLDELERLKKFEAGILGAVLRIGNTMNGDNE